MDKLRKLLTKPIAITFAIIAILPITPVALCLLYGWID